MRALTKVPVLVIVFAVVSEGLVITKPCCNEFTHRVALFGPILPSDDDSSELAPEPSVKSVGGPLRDTPADDPIFCANHRWTKVPRDYFKGAIALIPRGRCAFAKKVYLAQQTGAKAVIIYQETVNGGRNSENGLTGMAGDDRFAPRVTIPSAFISHQTWVSLRALRNGTELMAVLNATAAVGNSGADAIPMMWSSIVFLFRVFLIIWTFLGSVFLYNWVKAKLRKRRRFSVVRNLPSCKFANLASHTDQTGEAGAQASRASKKKSNRTYIEVDQKDSEGATDAEGTGNKMSNEEEVMVEIALHNSKSTEGESSFSCIECENCVICLCDYEQDDTVTILPCRHVYHKACIEPWLISKSALCPMCKQSILPCGDSRSLNEISDADPSGVPNQTEEDQRRTSIGLTLGMFMVIILSLSFTMFDKST